MVAFAGTDIRQCRPRLRVVMKQEVAVGRPALELIEDSWIRICVTLPTKTRRLELFSRYPPGLAEILRALGADRRAQVGTEPLILSLRLILGYRWQDYMSSDLVLRKLRLLQDTCIVEECQLRLYTGTWRGYLRRTKVYRRKVDAATRCSGECSHT